MIPHLPASTLFPYTTLFRSPPPVRGRPGVLVVLRLVVGRTFLLVAPPPVVVVLPPVVEVAPLGAAGGVGGMPGDRKSTRLNSSHQIISYAVFCLKKKKNRER